MFSTMDAGFINITKNRSFDTNSTPYIRPSKLDCLFSTMAILLLEAGGSFSLFIAISSHFLINLENLELV